MSSAPGRILTINTGSSSLKAGLYAAGADETLLLSAEAERIGGSRSRIEIRAADGATLLSRDEAFPNHAAALKVLFDWLEGERNGGQLSAVGHRVVHGGEQLVEPQLITSDVLATLQALVPVDPDHLPQAIAAVEAITHAYPDLPQVACFDTAFHRNMPAVARSYALPAEVREAGVVRFGFHGLSYEYIVQALQAEGAAGGRLIIAHLGNGASMAAVRDGVGVETTMGFTPTGGLVMGTRSGDLDPGVLLYLLQQRGLSPAALSELVNKHAGLLGLSGSSADMRDLLAREAADPRAALAVEIFCYTARKFVGALCAALGGLDTLVFTGGIGEHAAPVRQRICTGLEFLGIRLDPARNAANAAVVSANGSPVTVRVMHTNEDLLIARHTRSVNLTPQPALHDPGEGERS
jgi:acetate kinase